MNRKRTLLLLLIIIVLGTLLRIAAVMDSGSAPRHDCFPGMDEVNYRELSSNILDFHTYGAWAEGFFTRSTRSPLYPLLLACTYRLTFGCEWSPQILNILLDVLNIFLIFLIGTRLYKNTSGLIASGVYALFGPSFLYLPLSTPEIVTVMLLLSIALCLCYIQEYYYYIVPGFIIFYALLIHARPAFLLVTPFMAISLFFCLQENIISRKILKSVIPVFIIGICCLPWGIRNYRQHNAIVPICTISGWHIYTTALNKEQLSAKMLTNYIYAPERQDYSEGDYYKESIGKSTEYFLSHPFRSIYMGIARLVLNWSPPRPLYRFLLPKSYIIPIPVFPGIRLPLPDFEGYIYLFIFLSAIAAYKLKKRWFQIWQEWFNKSKGIVILLVTYTGVHIIGVPLTQYRFVIEPLLTLLGIGVITAYFQIQNDLDSPIVKDKTAKRFIMILTVILCICCLVPFFYKNRVRLTQFPADTASQKTENSPADYKTLRKLQWSHCGDIPDSPEVILYGTVKYMRQGLKHHAGKAIASPDKHSATGKLYVKYKSNASPLGEGDVKINFKENDKPENNDIVYIRGNASTGTYKDIIIDVEEWKIYQPDQQTVRHPVK